MAYSSFSPGQSPFPEPAPLPEIPFPAVRRRLPRYQPYTGRLEDLTPPEPEAAEFKPYTGRVEDLTPPEEPSLWEKAKTTAGGVWQGVKEGATTQAKSNLAATAEWGRPLDSQDWRDRWQAEGEQALRGYRKLPGAEAPTLFPGVSRGQLVEEVAPNVSQMATGLGGAALGAMKGAPRGPWGVATGAFMGALPSLAPMYGQVKTQTARSALEAEDARRQAAGQAPMGTDEAQAMQERIQPDIAREAAWEVGTEVPGMAIEAAAPFLRFGKPAAELARPAINKALSWAGAKAFGGGAAKEAAAQLATEPLEETVSQIGERPIEQRLGISEPGAPDLSFANPADYATAYQEVAGPTMRGMLPQTLLAAGLGGAGAVQARMRRNLPPAPPAVPPQGETGEGAVTGGMPATPPESPVTPRNDQDGYAGVSSPPENAPGAAGVDLPAGAAAGLGEAPAPVSAATEEPSPTGMMPAELNDARMEGLEYLRRKIGAEEIDNRVMDAVNSPSHREDPEFLKRFYGLDEQTPQRELGMFYDRMGNMLRPSVHLDGGQVYTELNEPDSEGNPAKLAYRMRGKATPGELSELYQAVMGGPADQKGPKLPKRLAERVVPSAAPAEAASQAPPSPPPAPTGKGREQAPALGVLTGELRDHLRHYPLENAARKPLVAAIQQALRERDQTGPRSVISAQTQPVGAAKAKTGHARTGQDAISPDQSQLVKTPAEQTSPVWSEPGKTGQAQALQEQTRQDKTRPIKTTPQEVTHAQQKPGAGETHGGGGPQSDLRQTSGGAAERGPGVQPGGPGRRPAEPGHAEPAPATGEAAATGETVKEEKHDQGENPAPEKAAAEAKKVEQPSPLPSPAGEGAKSWQKPAAKPRPFEPAERFREKPAPAEAPKLLRKLPKAWEKPAAQAKPKRVLPGAEPAKPTTAEKVKALTERISQYEREIEDSELRARNFAEQATRKITGQTLARGSTAWRKMDETMYQRQLEPRLEAIKPINDQKRAKIAAYRAELERLGVKPETKAPKAETKRPEAGPAPTPAETKPAKPETARTPGEFEEGDRVVLSGHYDAALKGRHGVVVKKQAITWRTAVIAITHQGVLPTHEREPERTVYYDVKTDNGTEVHASGKEVAAENEAAPTDTVPDIQMDGKWRLPGQVWSGAKSAMQAAKNEREAAARARKPEKKAALLQGAKNREATAKASRESFEAWAAQHPEAAQEASGGEWNPAAQGTPAAPAAETKRESALLDGPLESKNPKTGKPLYVVSIKTRVERPEYERLLGIAQKHHGYYFSGRRVRGAIPGFTFNDKADAAAFMNAVEPGTAEAVAEPIEQSVPQFKIGDTVHTKNVAVASEANTQGKVIELRGKGSALELLVDYGQKLHIWRKAGTMELVAKAGAVEALPEKSSTETDAGIVPETKMEPPGRQDGWRDNLIKTRLVAQGLKIPISGKTHAQLLASIDRADRNQALKGIAADAAQVRGYGPMNFVEGWEKRFPDATGMGGGPAIIEMQVRDDNRGQRIIHVDLNLQRAGERTNVETAAQLRQTLDEYEGKIEAASAEATPQEQPIAADQINLLDRVRFVPDRQRDTVITGEVVALDKSQVDSWRVRIRTDDEAPQGEGKLEWSVWSNNGKFYLLKRAESQETVEPARTQQEQTGPDTTTPEPSAPVNTGQDKTPQDLSKTPEPDYTQGRRPAVGQEPAPEAAKAETPEIAQARKDLEDALADLGQLALDSGFFSKSAAPPAFPSAKLLPVLSRVMDAAFRLGYYRFKAAAKFALDTIREKFGDAVADGLTLDHLQGAYIAMAGDHPGQGADSKAAVIAVDNLTEIQEYQDDTDQSGTGTHGAPSDERSGAGPVPGTGTGGESAGVRGGPGGGNASDLRSANGPGDYEGGQVEPGAPGTDSGNNLGTKPDLERDTGDLSGVRAGRDYRIGPGELTREGSWLETAKRNVAIVELIHRLEAENRPATQEEQAQILKFTGWGASDIRNKLFPSHAGIGTAYKPYYLDKAWQALGERIKEVFTEDDWKTALRSTQYAHYTSEPVVRGMWRALRQFGFAGGSVLEPGAGIGLFNGLMPEDLARSSKYVGIEMDGFSAKIAALLYPEQTINPAGQGDFIKAKLPKNFFDITIGNPPFQAKSQIPYNGMKLSLHDFFFAKALDQVRPGGLLAFVTSHHTLDKVDSKARDYLAAQADLLGAIRLPDTAFLSNAGTEVVTDVLFLRKRDRGQLPGGAAWKNLATVTGADGKPATINEYFAEHPEMVLGEHSQAGTMYGPNQYTVKGREGDLGEQFAAAVRQMPENVYSVQTAAAATGTIRAAAVEKDWNPKHRKEGGVYLSDKGELMRVEGGAGAPLESMVKLNAREKAWLKDYVPLRDALKQAQFDQLSEGDWQASLKALQKAYTAFVKQHGPVLAYKNRETKEVDEDGNETTVTSQSLLNQRLMRMDVEGSLLNALERIKENGEIVRGSVLLDRVLKKPVTPKIESVHDALAVNLMDTGRFDLDGVAKLAGLSREEAIAGLGDLLFEQTDGSHMLAEEYLSGDVKTKLEEARAAAAVDEKFNRNVEALLKVQPEPLGSDQITAGLGATWVPLPYFTRFAREVMTIKDATVSFDPVGAEFSIDSKTGPKVSRSASHTWGTAERSPLEILDAALNHRTLKVYKGSGTKDDPRYLDRDATDKANEMVARLEEEFGSWVWTDAERTGKLLEIYNEKFNRLAPRYFEAEFLNPPGLSLRYKLHSHQKRAIWRAIQTGNTYFAHAVGAGKTLEMIIAGMEQKRLGLINKPMYMVPNHMLNQFAREFLEAYPAANIMVADEHNFHTENRRRFIAQATFNAPDAVIITHSAFNLLEMKPENVQDAFKDVLDDLRSTLEEIPPGFENQKTRRQIEAQIEKIERGLETKEARTKDKNRAKLAAYQANRDRILGEIADAEEKHSKPVVERLRQELAELEASKDALDAQAAEREVEAARNSAVFFEDLGVDFLFCDEAHQYRKLDYATKTQVKGLSPEGSVGALRLFVKTRWLDSQRPGRSFVFASGTPVTNTMAELFTVQRFFQEKQMRELGIINFDAWAAQFGRVKIEYERNATGVMEAVKRFSKFVNVADLMTMVRQQMDVLTMDQLAGIVTLPKVAEGNAGRRNIVVTPQVAELTEYMNGPLAARLKASRDWKPSKAEPNNPDPVTNIITDGRLAAIDMRFIRPSLPSNPDSKLNQLIDTMIEDYGKLSDAEYLNPETEEPDTRKGGTQIVFASVGLGKMVAQTRGFSAKEWIKGRLKEAKIPPGQVVFMDDLNTAEKKEAAFKDMRGGKIRLLIGTPKNMGTGVNVQNRLARLYHLDAPWYPADVEQPEGRILRQGNQNEQVAITGFATDGTYDATMWGMVARKAGFIEQAFAGDRSLRVMDDLSEAGAYSMAAAIASGDQRFIRLAELEGEVTRLETQRSTHEAQQRSLEHDIRRGEGEIRNYRQRLGTAKQIAAELGERAFYSQSYDATVGGVLMPRVKSGDLGVAVLREYGRVYSKALDQVAAKALASQEMAKNGDGKEKRVTVDELVGSIGDDIEIRAEVTATAYRKGDKDQGLTREIAYAGTYRSLFVRVKGNELWSDISTDAPQHANADTLGQRVNSVLNEAKQMPDRIQNKLAETQRELEGLKRRFGTPFARAREQYEKVAELEALRRELLSEGKAVPTVMEGQAGWSVYPRQSVTGGRRAATLAPAFSRPSYTGSEVSIHEVTGTLFDHAGKPLGTVAEGRGAGGLRGYSITRAEADRLADAGLRVFRLATRGPDTTGLQGWFLHGDTAEALTSGELPARLNYVTGARIPWRADLIRQVAEIEQTRDRLSFSSAPTRLGQSAHNTSLRITIERGGSAQPGALYRRGAPGGGLSVDAVREALRAGMGPGLAKLEADGTVQILRTVTGAPEAMRDRLRGDESGFYWDGRAYLIAANLNRAQVVPTLLHELGEHYGLERMIGAKAYAGLQARIQALHEAGNARVTAAWEAVLREYTETDPKTGAAKLDPKTGKPVLLFEAGSVAHVREVIAKLGERGGLQESWWKALLGKIRVFLLRHGLMTSAALKGLSDADLHGLLVASVRAAMGKEAVPRVFPTSALAPAHAARPAGVFYSELAQQLGGVKASKAPGVQWKAIINGLKQKGVKQDEIEWSGVMEWLDLAQGPVSKEAVQGFLEGNGVRVDEVAKGGIRKLSELPEDQRSKVKEIIKDNDYLGFDSMGQAVSAYVEAPLNYDIPEDDRRELDRILGTDLDVQGPPKFAQWQLPGGENYRELLITLPNTRLEALRRQREELSRRMDKTKDFAQKMELDRQRVKIAQAIADLGKASLEFKSGHFDEPNILAHVRFNERTDADGKRVLFIEEIQSDWGQRGKKEGFITKDSNRPEHRNGQWGVVDRAGNFWRMANEAEARRSAGAAIPAAPFVTDTKAWVALALKRMVRYGAENGFDRIAWTTGEQQAERYDLSKQIDRLEYERDPQMGWKLEAYKGGDRVQGLGVYKTEAELADVVGKEIAQKIVNGEGTRHPKYHAENYPVMVLKGVDLKVGGEGMKGFYDAIVPQVANQLLKRFGGGKVITIGESSKTPQYSIEKRSNLFVIEDINGKQVGGFYYDRSEALKARRELEEKIGAMPGDQPGFDLTPQLKDRALMGLPLFRREAGDGARLARARAQGYDTSQRWYHGTPIGNDIRAFDTGKIGSRTNTRERAIFLTDNPDVAASYGYQTETILEGLTAREEETGGTILPLYIRGKLFDASGEVEGLYDREIFERVIEQARQDGYDGVDFGLIIDVPADTPYGYPEGRVVAMFQPNHIRSIHGEFDPGRKGLDDLLFSRPDRSSGWAPERIDRLLRLYAYGMNEQRSKAYAAWISPEDFLKATTPGGNFEGVQKRAVPLDEAKLAENEQEIFLQVDGTRIIGHEGRHRMAALMNAGASRVPITLIMRDGGKDRTALGRMGLSGQDFGEEGRGRPVVVSSVTPINYASEQALRTEFGQGGAAPLFSRPDTRPEAGLQAVEGPAQARAAQRPERPKAMQWWDKLKRDGRRQRLGLLKRDQLAEVAEPVLPDILQRYLPIAKAIDADRNETHEKLGKITQAWSAAAVEDRAGADAMANLMHDETLAGVDGSKPYRPIIDIEEAKKTLGALRQSRDAQVASKQRQARLAPGDAARYVREANEITANLNAQMADVRRKMAQEAGRRAKFEPLRKRWAALPKAFQRIHNQVRDYHEWAADETLKALIARIQASAAGPVQKRALIEELRLEFESARVTAPYFPLGRVGDYWVYAKDKAGNPSFDMFETREEQAAFMAELKEEGAEIAGRGKRGERTGELPEVSAGFVARVEARVAELGNLPEVRDLRDDIWQLYLQTLPELSARRHAIHRQKRAGFSADALQSTARKGFHDAYMLGRLRHTHKLEGVLADLEAMVNLAESDAQRAALRRKLEWYEEYQGLRGHTDLASLQAAKAATAATAASAELDLERAQKALAQLESRIARRGGEGGQGERAAGLRETVKDLRKSARLAAQAAEKAAQFHTWFRQGFNPGPAMAQALHRLEGAERVGGQDNGIDQARDYLGELGQFHAEMLNPSGSWLASVANSFGFSWFIGASISSALVNSLQTPTVAMPFAAARYGMGPTLRAFKQAFAEFFSTRHMAIEAALLKKARGFAPGSEGRRRALADLKGMRALQRAGVFDKTLSHDLAGLAEEGVDYSGTRARWMGWMSFAFHHTERMNREITARAVYLLAQRAQAGKGVADSEARTVALREAERMTHEAHLDYTAANRARFMRGTGRRIIFQFKQYSQGITYLLLRAAHQAFKGASPEQKAEARKRIGGLLAMQFLFAGAKGLPIGLAVWAAQALAGALGDDDEPWDWEVEARKALLALGEGVGLSKEAAQTFERFAWKGGVDTFTPWAISDRVGMSELWVRDPDKELEGKDLSLYLYKTLGGPMTGIAENWVNGTRLIADGNYERGIEKFLPAWAAHLLKAGRFAEEDAKTLKGLPLVNDLSPAELAGQAIGFMPARLSAQYEINTARMNRDQALTDRRRELLQGWAAAIQAKDAEARKEAQAEALRFNRLHPAYAVFLPQVLQSVRQQGKIERSAVGGLPVSKRMKRDLETEF